MIWKVFVFWIGTFIFLLSGYIACRVSRYCVYAIFALMLFSLCDIEHFSINFAPHPDYKTATRGFEIALADLCAVILFIHVLINIPRKERVKIPPLVIPQVLMILVALISWSLTPQHASNPMAASQSSYAVNSANYALSLESVFSLHLYPLFEISKLLRGLFIFWVMVNLSRDNNFIKIMYAVFSFLILYFTAKSLILRYAFHVNRVTAGIGHYNNFNTFIGLMGAFMVPLAFTTRRFLLSAFVWYLVLCVVLCIILTISRSALLAFGVALMFGVPILTIKYFSPKNIFFPMLGAVAMLGMLIKAQNTLAQRFLYKNPTQVAWDARRALDNEGSMMAHDFPFGVGMGNFSAYSIMRYAALTNAEVGNFAHNSFYLTLGELGYPGLIVFTIYWLRYFQLALTGLFYRLASSDRFAVGAMMSTTLSIIFLVPQLWFQFTYRATAVYLLVHIIMGFGVGQYLLARQERRVRLAERERGHGRRQVTTKPTKLVHT